MRRSLGARLAGDDRNRRSIAAGLPMFGYFWRGGQPPAISLDDAHRTADQANVELARDPASATLHAIQPGTWEPWTADEQKFAVYRDAAGSLGVTRAASFIKR